MANTPEHEAKCRKCGRCCYHTVHIGNELVVTPMKCVHLDAETGLCGCYEQRHEMYPECLPMVEAIRRRILPDDCPYVAGIKGYKGPRDMRDSENGMIMGVAISNEAWRTIQQET